jgi:tellurite resistance protein
MRKTELIRYFANVIRTAAADGTISQKEEKAIERIYKEIHAKEVDLQEAKGLTQDGDY